MKKKLSFILPVYNVEKYLEECIDSILQQMTDECEIVLVNDGSTDSSGAICGKYALENPNIVVIHKENGGLSSARNTGIKEAIGEYIIFVDSDDRISNGSVKKILSWMEETTADFCFLQITKFYPDGTQENMGENIRQEFVYGKSKEEVLKYLTVCPKYPGSACSKIFRKKFLEEKDLYFPYDRRHSEDLGFIRDCMLMAEKFDVLEFPFYEYRQNRDGSITNNITGKTFFDLFLFVTESIEKLTIKKEPIGIQEECMMSFVAYEYGVLLLLFGQLSKAERKYAYERLIEYQWVMKFAKSRKVKMIRMILSLLGIKVTSELLNLYKRYN